MQTSIEAIENKLLAFAGRQRLFMPETRVIAACSGGADSMALLLFLLRKAESLHILVEACHVNHGLREGEADRDQRFVEDFCHARGVKLHLYNARKEGARIPPNAGEDWARRLRYGFFERLAGEGAVIATAHTLTDQAETLLFRMARGTGLHGLAGIPARRAGFVRPLLCLERAETEAYCRSLGQAWVTDTTNLGDAYARNRIRHHALPVLRAVNPAAEQAMGRLAAQMARADEYLARRAGELLQKAARPGAENAWCLGTLQAADPVELEWALHALVGRRRDPEEKYIRLLESCVRAGSGAVQLREDVAFRAEQGWLILDEQKEPPAPPAPLPLAEGQYSLPGGYRMTITLEKYEKTVKSAVVHKKDLKCLADYAKIKSGTLLRTRRPGDTFAEAGRGAGKSLKKLYNELAIPLGERPLLPLLARENQVLWLWGRGFAEGLGPDEGTETVLRIETMEKGSEEDVDAR